MFKDTSSRSLEEARPAPILRMGRAVAGIDVLMQDQAIVIFDLSQNPATVLNATEKFCQFLGYRAVLSRCYFHVDFGRKKL